MLSSITPFGERARRQKYWVTVLFFTIGTTIGGLLLGFALAVPAAVVSVTLGGSAVAALVVLIAASLWDVAGLAVPSISRQVDENWLSRYRGWVYGLGYGVQLGLGYVTYVKTALTYGFSLAVITSGEPALCIVAGSVFGFVRGISLTATSHIQGPEALRSLFQRLDRLRLGTRLAGGAAVLLIAVSTLASGL